MSSRSSILGLAALGLLAFGCSKSSDQGTAQGTPAATNPADTAPAVPLQDAKVVVKTFLEAYCKGDNDTAAKLLTKVARQKAQESGRSVAPPTNDDSARVEVEDAEYGTPEHDIAHVPAKLIVLDEMGKPRADKAIWICRLEPEGWRVGGLAAFVFGEGEKPVLLNFEKPEEMAERQKQFTKELEQRAKRETISPADQDTPSQAENKPQDAFRR
jgi:hypothetical protein